MKYHSNVNIITTINYSRTTIIDSSLRRSKLDDFPQFYNVFISNMSFLDPRPDALGYSDKWE